MRKFVLFSILLALSSTPAYANGNSHSGGGSSNSGSSHSDHSSSFSSSQTTHSTSGSDSSSSSTSPTGKDHVTASNSHETQTKELDNRFKHAETLQSTELKTYADQLKNSLTQEVTSPERGKYYSKLSELYEKSGDLTSAIETKEQEIQTDYTNPESVQELGQLYSQAGDTDVKTFINGHKAHFDTPPVIKDGHTVIPIRGVSESLKADVQWDSETKTITITRDDTIIVLTVGSNVATVNGQAITLDASSTIMNGRAFVPLRFVSEALKAQVNWVDGGVINISDGSTTGTETPPADSTSTTDPSGATTPTGENTTPTDSSVVTPPDATTPTDTQNTTDPSGTTVTAGTTSPSTSTNATGTLTTTNTTNTTDSTGTPSSTDTSPATGITP